MNGRPLGITIIAIILAVSGVFLVLVGMEALGVTSLGLGAVAEAAGISGGAQVIGGVLSIIVAGGIFTLAGWAWILAVVVLFIRIAVDIFAVVTHGAGSTLGIGAITNLVVSAVILWYFQRPGIKAAFGR
ncbi:MAG: hypothetical protein E4H22_06270 [Solirubrobacterales bacterium]|jgi:hypothetical protein|nr:MAG: hypothetical protein E4H22_06270 [Solirubrobacterales bacterium]